MKIKHVTIWVIALVLLDQLLKIWIKTNLCIGEAIDIFSWFKLQFVENNGAAFGMQLSSSGGFDWGKLLLSLFRVVMIGLLGYFVYRISKRESTPKGVIIGTSLILAGAIGNLIDSMFYGMIFSESTFTTVAHWGDGYGNFMMGKVVDMFYFPLFQWNGCPSWLSFLVDHNNYFFGPVFNLADSYISVAVVYLLLFHFKYLNK